MHHGRKVGDYRGSAARFQGYRSTVRSYVPYIQYYTSAVCAAPRHRTHTPHRTCSPPQCTPPAPQTAVQTHPSCIKRFVQRTDTFRDLGPCPLIGSPEAHPSLIAPRFSPRLAKACPESLSRPGRGQIRAQEAAGSISSRGLRDTRSCRNRVSCRGPRQRSGRACGRRAHKSRRRQRDPCAHLGGAIPSCVPRRVRG